MSTNLANRALATATILCALSACGHHAGQSGDDGGTPGADAAASVEEDAAAAPDADVDAGSSLAPDADRASDAAQSPDAGESLDAAAQGDASAADAGSDHDSGPGAADAAQLPDGSVIVRVMAANLSSGNNQSYDPGEGLRLIEGVRPDVVLIQEFNYGDNADATIQKVVTDTLGTEFAFCRRSGQIPNGVLSRWPIAECNGWKDPKVGNRDFTYARIDLPVGRTLWAVSLHLLTTTTSERNAEAVSLVKYIQATVPAGDYLVVGGDLNTDAVTEGCINTLSAVVVAPGARPVDQKGNSNTSAARNKPHDYVFACPLLNALQVPSAFTGPTSSSTYPNGLVLDSRVYTPLSEIAPVQYGDSGASGMQHMGVIRDFLALPP
jgi:endonuclease/exonuclease/phosphatase family metal-dependent hydrolase